MVAEPVESKSAERIVKRSVVFAAPKPAPHLIKTSMIQRNKPKLTKKNYNFMNRQQEVDKVNKDFPKRNTMQYKARPVLDTSKIILRTDVVNIESVMVSSPPPITRDEQPEQPGPTQHFCVSSIPVMYANLAENIIIKE